MSPTLLPLGSVTAAIPEIWLAAAACLILMLDVYFDTGRRGLNGLLTLVLLAAGAALTA